MKWIQVNDVGLTHEFELDGDESTKITLIGNIETVKGKLRRIFGPEVEIETFDDKED